jgi:hypothetical protein
VKAIHLTLVLTLVNLGLLGLHTMPSRDAGASEALPLLRGRGLEIVDEQGRLRAQVKLEPANPDYVWPDGSRKGYPETVILRLMSADGNPGVKLTTSQEGSGLLLTGASDETYAVLHSEGRKTSLRLRNDAKTERILAP